jgi:hypothetical protein
LLLVNIFLNPPEGGLNGRGTGFLIGYLFGGAAVLLLIVAAVYGIARLIRRHKTPPAAAAVAFWTLLTLAGLDMIRAVGGGGPHAATAVLTAADRQGLEIAGDSIRHRGLGFAMPSPGPTFAPSPALQARMDSSLSGHPDMVAWVLTSTDVHATLIIQLMKFPFSDEARFRSFARGLHNTLTGAKGVTVLIDSVRWEPPDGDYRLAVRYPVGTFLRTRCISRSRPDGSFVLCAQTGSGDSDALASVRDGLSMRH